MTTVREALAALEDAHRRGCNYCAGDIAMCERGGVECRAKDARAALAQEPAEIDAIPPPMAVHGSGPAIAKYAPPADDLAREPAVDAQHGETGRMWHGPRSAIPSRYNEVTPCPDGDACPDARKYGAVHPPPADDLVARLRYNQSGLHREAADRIEALLRRIDGYQGSREWAIDRLALALGMEADKVRPVEYYADQCALRIEALQAEVARLTRAKAEGR